MRLPIGQKGLSDYLNTLVRGRSSTNAVMSWQTPLPSMRALERTLPHTPLFGTWLSLLETDSGWRTLLGVSGVQSKGTGCKLGRTYRRRIGIALVILLAAGVVCTLGILVYLERLRGLASALITSAYEIQTKADADREIAAWSKRFGKDFWEESDHPGGDHNYDAQIVNLTLARFHIVQPTGVTVGITVRGGQLRSVAVIESTGWYPVASVWVQEWFDEEMPRRIRVVGNRRPYAARVEFPASLPEDQRKKAFAL